MSDTPKPILLRRKLWMSAAEKWYNSAYSKRVSSALLVTAYIREFYPNLIDDHLGIKGATKMARGYTPIKWVDITLSAEQKKEFKSAWDANDDTLITDIDVFIAAGYKFTCGSDEKSGAVRCTVTVKNDALPNHGKGFSSFAPNALMAMCISAFKLAKSDNDKEWLSTSGDDFG